MVSVTHDSGLLRELRRVLDMMSVRLVLSACIILSLLPYPAVRRLDWMFLALFSAEFLVRAALVFRGRWREEPGVGDGTPGDVRRWPPLTQIVPLALDLIALISFLPLTGIGIEARWLRLFRLTRMLMLIGYWAPLLKDVWSVMSRRERARQVALMGVVVLGLSFGGAVILENVAESHGVVDFDDDGEITRNDREFFVHLWWAFRQVQDPGNMVATPNQAAAVIVSIGLTVFGLFLVSFLIGLGTDVVRELMEISQLRGPGLRGHTVILNINPSTRPLLSELMGYYQKLLPEGSFSWRWLYQLFRNTRNRGLSRRRYVIVGRGHEPPDFLRQADLAQIIYRQGSLDDGAAMIQRADIRSAQRVVLLADLEAKDPDAETIRALLTIGESLREGAPINTDLPTADPHHRRRARPRLLIAEIVDESNVPAARAAIASSGEHTHAFVVPSERLIALFVACVARRPGIEAVLEELLSSHGHEVYTCFFDVPGLRYAPDQAPPLPSSQIEAMAYLGERALALSPAERALPVGLLMRRYRPPVGTPALKVRINPRVDDPPEEARCCGFVAIASNFEVVREFAEALQETPGTVDAPLGPEGGAPAQEPAYDVPEFERSPVARLHRVLICGFRSATVSAIEALLHAEPNAEILVMVIDAEAKAAALDDFDAHTNLVRNRLLLDHGVFLSQSDGSLCYVDDEDEVPPRRRGRIHVEIGDWTSSRRLTRLPRAFGHVATIDVVLLIAEDKRGSDARTTQALMKIETLSARAGNAGGQRIVAEVFDAELARRLRRHYAQLGIENVKVYSIQVLRAFLMFQSVVVPSFDVVYTELLGPWGQSIVQLRPKTRKIGACSYRALSHSLNHAGYILIGVELVGDDGPVLHLGEGGPERGELVDLERLRGLWVICGDVDGACA
ncbi:MAG: hypothetical protein R3A51_08300 [Nannocystaceae bacterium]|nr:ion transporter [Myxococcales bacterium]